jgi:hypothetical protein
MAAFGGYIKANQDDKNTFIAVFNTKTLEMIGTD